METTSLTLLDEIRAFMKSRVVLTAAELDLFSRLDGKPKSAQELTEELGADAKAMARLLDCLVTFGLLEKQEGRYLATDRSSLLSSDHPQTVLPMVLHMNHLWDTWSGLTGIVRKGQLRSKEFPSAFSMESLRNFIGAMHVVGSKLSAEIARTYDLSPFQRLLDIGGGSGTYTIAFLGTNPAMRAVLFDLEPVLSLADERIRAAGIRDRVELVAGDFYRDDLPRGCDLALLSAVIHQNSPGENLELYRKIFRALEPGGILLIRDHIMDEPRTRPPAGALFALNMLVNTPGGDTYTFREVREGLEEAGFVKVRQVRTGENMDDLVEARAPLS